MIFFKNPPRFDCNGYNPAPFQRLGRTLGILLWAGLLALAPLAAAAAEPSVEAEAALVASARKHITESIPKGLTPTKEAEVRIKTKTDKIRAVEFTLELECDEPRYVVRDLMSAGKALPGEVSKQLQADGLSGRFLSKKHDKGDTIPSVHDTFSIRPDGTFGAIKALAPEKFGCLRSEQPELPVEGDAKQQAAKTAADAQVEALQKARAERANATTVSIFGGLKDLGGAIGGIVGNKDTQAKINAATNAATLVAPTAPATAAAPPQVAQASPAPAPAAAPTKGNGNAATTSGEKAGKPEAADKADADWLTPTEAAAKLKISESDVLNAINSGDIKAKKIGPVWRIRAKDLQ